MTWPTTCAAVQWDMKDESYGQSAVDAEIGDLLWNPKGGKGHVIVAEVPCDGGKHDCGCGGHITVGPHTTLLCECGQDDSWRDHHYELLAKAAR
ncbi:hypothetical protein DSM104299_03187 [Baekduia alba]|uniref:hypothetical protein n=1 Tax=Baekduia alba TaxID=2997333 RepID=UPI00234106F8|nr:hypothetical protein [Baekduia alba]WCB94450.1 hypothetical protein DSM104299_03187 [Baekduia alba]